LKLPASNPKINTLFYGDNLDILRNHIGTETIDLIYLDPPFNSKADYNVLFKEKGGESSHAQIQAFSDSWVWDVEAKHAYDELTTQAPNLDVSNLTKALFDFLGKNDMMAYLVMMGVRLIELQRVLKPTGSLFLHCDSTASHYLKIMLDSIFGLQNFRNEIVWKRIQGHSDAKRFGKVSDRILFYSKTDEYKFNTQTVPHSAEYLESRYPTDKDGRRYALDNLNPPGGRGPVYEFHGLTRPWRFTQEKMLKLEAEGRIYTKSRVPRLMRYLDELKVQGGAVVTEVWTDIFPVNSQAKERLGYPTQKPLALLERIIEAGSDEGDWVLDPFCGCGTAVVAAEKDKRHWIGIDITYLAINLIKTRLKDAFPKAKFEIEGEPKDLAGAVALSKKDRYQFQWWVVSLVGARPYGSTTSNPKEGKKGADEGIDGWMKFHDGEEGNVETVIVQVKSGGVGAKDIRELRDRLQAKRAALGLFITLEAPTSEMTKEARTTDPYVSPIWNQQYPKIQILTIEDLLNGVKPSLPPTLNLFAQAEKEKYTDTSEWGKIS